MDYKPDQKRRRHNTEKRESSISQREGGGETRQLSKDRRGGSTNHKCIPCKNFKQTKRGKK